MAGWIGDEVGAGSPRGPARVAYQLAERALRPRSRLVRSAARAGRPARAVRPAAPARADARRRSRSRHTGCARRARCFRRQGGRARCRRPRRRGWLRPLRRTWEGARRSTPASEPAEDRGLVPGSGADLEHAFAAAQRESLDHRRHQRRLRRHLTQADRDRAVEIGVADAGERYIARARHGGHGGKNTRVPHAGRARRLQADAPTHPGVCSSARVMRTTRRAGVC
jgi:hypothetical protein